MSWQDKQPECRIMYAYDSETTNVDDGSMHVAFPILHQLGVLDVPLSEIDAENVEDHVTVETYRHTFELCMRLDEIVCEKHDYIPVMMCHNLAFDMYGIAEWLNAHDVKVLAKSSRKPITFQILDDDGNVRLIIWDTLIFSQKPLAKMGVECGYSKASGDWDYSKIRTPETPLTDSEMRYAKRDVYALFAWMAYWFRRNPDIPASKAGRNVVTKTGVVRLRCAMRFGELKGRKAKKSVAQYWNMVNQSQSPVDDDELFTMHACTRGGFTFCSSRSASVVYDLQGTGKYVYGYDATSQHPAQMVSHYYPIGFHKTSEKALELAFEQVCRVDIRNLLKNWGKPFACAFNACFKFANLRPKPGTVYERNGIFPLASARLKKPRYDAAEEDNEQARQFEQGMHDLGYCDYVEGGKIEFGKLVSADSACLYLTELAAWEVSHAYEWDSVEAVGGYMTTRFTRPHDMSVISVMQFYKAKNLFKQAREEYMNTGTISNADELKTAGIPSVTVDEMQAGTAYDLDVDFTYLGLKADLNSLFGVNATNEYRKDTVLTEAGIGYEGEEGICNKPKNPKCWYQFGQRIVGWSRIAQCCVLELLHDHVECVVNGDTDSVKVVAFYENLVKCNAALSRLARAIDVGKSDVCARVRVKYPEMFDKLDGIGHYVQEFACEQYCASWNKAYVIRERDKRDGLEHCKFTLAGIPTRRRQVMQGCELVDFPGIDGLADRHCADYGFAETCNLLLGYNVTYSPGLLHLNMRTFPEWGAAFTGRVTDYQGATHLVSEPMALNLHPMAKTVNDTGTAENAANMEIAVRNNPGVNVEPVALYEINGRISKLEMAQWQM